MMKSERKYIFQSDERKIEWKREVKQEMIEIRKIGKSRRLYGSLIRRKE